MRKFMYFIGLFSLILVSQANAQLVDTYVNMRKDVVMNEFNEQGIVVKEEYWYETYLLTIASKEYDNLTANFYLAFDRETMNCYLEIKTLKSKVEGVTAWDLLGFILKDYGYVASRVRGGVTFYAMLNTSHYFSVYFVDDSHEYGNSFTIFSVNSTKDPIEVINLAYKYYKTE